MKRNTQQGGITRAHRCERATVEEDTAFRKNFDDVAEMRQSAGATGSTVYQSVDNPNEITIRNDFPTAEAAKAFASSEGLREAMKRGGVQASPTIWFVNET